MGSHDRSGMKVVLFSDCHPERSPRAVQPNDKPLRNCHPERSEYAQRPNAVEGSAVRGLGIAVGDQQLPPLRSNPMTTPQELSS